VKREQVPVLAGVGAGAGFLQSGRLLLWFEGDEYTASLVAEDPDCKGTLRRVHGRALGYSTGRGDVRIFVLSPCRVNSLASVSRPFAPAR